MAGSSREYLTFAPDTLTSPAPVIVLLHGFTGLAAAVAAATGLDVAAPSAGVLLVVPQGSGEPSGWEIPNWGTDAEFVSALLDTVASCVDPARVWIAGHSAGSAFAAFYGCSNADRVAGMVLVSALPPPLCTTTTPATLIVHGTADPVVPFDGGPQQASGSEFVLKPVPESTGDWAAAAGCDPTPAQRRLEPDVAVTEWTGCAAGSVVRLHAIEGGGHEWPRDGGLDAGCLVVAAALANPDALPAGTCPD